MRLFFFGRKDFSICQDRWRQHPPWFIFRQFLLGLFFFLVDVDAALRRRRALLCWDWPDRFGRVRYCPRCADLFLLSAFASFLLEGGKRFFSACRTRFSNLALGDRFPFGSQIVSCQHCPTPFRAMI